MNELQKGVQDWMRTFQQDTPEKPQILDEKTAKLRARLILEEALEIIQDGLGLTVHFVNIPSGQLVSSRSSKDLGFIFTNGGKPQNLALVLDGVADLGFVSEGTAVACGLDTEPAHREVLRSNLSKLWALDELPLAPEDSVKTLVGERYLVKRLDGKVLKSPSYSEADIQSIVDEQLK